MPQGRILIVEDEALLAMDLQTTLEQLGYETPQIATTGNEAMEKAARERPDVALMDVNIHGGMDGIEAARRLNSEFGISIIFMTGYSDEDIRARGKTVKHSAILTKPLNIAKLKSAIESAIREAA